MSGVGSLSPCSLTPSVAGQYSALPLSHLSAFIVNYLFYFNGPGLALVAVHQHRLLPAARLLYEFVRGLEVGGYVDLLLVAYGASQTPGLTLQN